MVWDLIEHQILSLCLPKLTKKELFGPEAVQLKGQIDHQQAEQATVSPICMWSSNLMIFKNQLVSSKGLFGFLCMYLFINISQQHSK